MITGNYKKKTIWYTKAKKIDKKIDKLIKGTKKIK